jgi:hypothetical protein
MLVRIAKVDYGYDLQRWHDHFKEMPRSESLGYTWNRTIALPKVMREAVASDEWRSTARALSSGTKPYSAIGKCPSCGCPLLDSSLWAEGFFDAFTDVAPARTLFSVACPGCAQILLATPKIGQQVDTVEWQRPLTSDE